MEFWVQITAGDLAAGEPFDPQQCPLAHALRRHLPLATRVSVHRCLFIEDGDGSAYLGFPDGPLRHWLMDFDHGRPVEPKAFWLAFKDVSRDLSPEVA